MPTQSFYEILKIETEEQGQILLKAFEDADNRPPTPPLVPSSEEMVRRGDRLIEEGYFDCLIRSRKTK